MCRQAGTWVNSMSCVSRPESGGRSCVRKRLILVELNEINFDVVRCYMDARPAGLKGFRRLTAWRQVRTTSEAKYEHLEPWVQWPSVHTGESYDGHRLFRLGDVATSTVPQFFEQLESEGWRVGALSPMNAANRLRAPAYFIPDPWTVTPSDGSLWSERISSAISQAVNDNAQAHIRPINLIWLLLAFVRFARPRNYWTYLKLALRSRGAPWRKALFLDLFLHDLHLRLFGAHRPDFSVLFLNAGAHIQHHYFLNAAPLKKDVEVRNPEWYAPSNADPMAEMVEIYDRIVADYCALPGVELIIATGLSQRPYDRVKFYYRLVDHTAFLRMIGIRFRRVLPRMTRDFLVEFDDPFQAREAEGALGSISVDGKSLFGEIDNRGASLFVTLTFPDEITSDSQFEYAGSRKKLAPHVAFVAIKNGMHQETGYAYFSKGVAPYAPVEGGHVRALYWTVMNYFRGRTTGSA